MVIIMDKPTPSEFGLYADFDEIEVAYTKYKSIMEQSSFNEYVINRFGKESVITDEKYQKEKNRISTINKILSVISGIIIATIIAFILRGYIGGDILVFYIIIVPGLISSIMEKIFFALFFKRGLDNLKSKTLSGYRQDYWIIYRDFYNNKYAEVIDQKQKKDNYEKELRRYNREKELAEKRQKEEYWQSLDGDQFEQEVASCFRNVGFEAIVSPKGADEGIDIVLKQGGKRYVVQCKAHEAKISQPVVRDLLGVINNKKNPFDGGVLVCTNGVTKQAKEWCIDNDIKVLNINSLIKMSEGSMP